MTNTGRRRHPDRSRILIVLFALTGAAFASAACAGQLPETAAAHDDRAGVAVAQAAAPGDGTEQETHTFTPLGRAALDGDVETVERLLGEGTDVDAVSAWGTTPLMWSFQLLILPSKTSGPDPVARQAHLARQKRKLRIAGLLLDHGADFARADRDGMAALHYLALMDGEEPPLLETLQAFMAKGADPNVSDSHGMTPLIFAAFRNRPQLVTALLSAGADPKATRKTAIRHCRLPVSAAMRSWSSCWSGSFRSRDFRRSGHGVCYDGNWVYHRILMARDGPERVVLL